MTIIEPNKAKYSYNPSLLLLALSLIGLVLCNIYIYNENVGLKHSISAGSRNLQELQVANAELKNELYKITDISNLTALVKANNLIKEIRPKYFEKTVDVLAVN